MLLILSYTYDFAVFIYYYFNIIMNLLVITLDNTLKCIIKQLFNIYLIFIYTLEDLGMIIILFI